MIEGAGKGFDLYLQNGEALEKSGFPTPPPDDVPTCDGVPRKLCSREGIYLVYSAGFITLTATRFL